MPSLSLLYDLTQKTNFIEGDILEIGSAWGSSTVLLSFASNLYRQSRDKKAGLVYILK